LLLKKTILWKWYVQFFFTKQKFLKNIKKNSPVMIIWFHKIPCYNLNKRILWKLYLLYTDYLISQKSKKCSRGKYALLLYLAISIMFDAFWPVHWKEKIKAPGSFFIKSATLCHGFKFSTQLAYHEKAPNSKFQAPVTSGYWVIAS